MFPSRGFLVKSILLAGLCAAVVGCPKQPNGLQLALQATPTTLDFGITDTPLPFVVRPNMDTDQPLTITAVVDPGATWLSVDPAMGTSSSPNEPITMTAHIDRGKLKKGVNSANITVTSPGAVQREVLVTANTPLAADFVGNPKEIWQGESVKFEDRTEVVAVEDAITEWDWDYGDGTPHGKFKEVTHTYDIPGKKTVILTVSSATQKHDTETKFEYITVNKKIPPSASFTTAPESGIAGSPIQFTDKSVAGTSAITSWLWDFGDGERSTLRNPAHAFATRGNYMVSLTATSSHGSGTWTKFISVQQVEPTAEFTYPGYPGDVRMNMPIQFTDTSDPGTAPILSWAWNFGDGVQSAVQHPVHTFALNGQYTVSLTVTTIQGVSSVQHTVTAIKVAPIADFIADPPSPLVNTVVRFTDRSAPGTAAITQWLWDFGDNSSPSPVQNPSHTYKTGGTFWVTLTVTSAHGTHSETKALAVRTEPPAASFTATPTNSYVGHDIQFTDTSVAGTSPIISWLWEFGDGQQSTQKNATHKYAQAGTFTVSLTVTTADGTDTATMASLIRILPAVKPAASFTISNATPLEADEVTFTDTSVAGSSPITAWLWDFGDGGSSTERNPLHTYNQAGRFIVSLTVTTFDGSSTTSKPVTVGVNTDPTANFKASPTTLLAGSNVKFTDLSLPGTSPIISWLWNFGDGAAAPENNQSSEQNPNHLYAEPGMFTVSLTVVTKHGNNTKTITDFITIMPRPDFSANPTTAFVGKPVQFTDLTRSSLIPITKWLWAFGDGLTSSEQNPVHVYGMAGTYDVSLTVTLANGFKGTTKKSSLITTTIAQPVADFNISNLTPYMYETVNFTDISDPGSAAILTWSWDLADGNFSAAKNPSVVYKTSGVKSITLTVTTPFGSNSVTKTITVGVPSVSVRFKQDKTIVFRRDDGSMDDEVTVTSTSSMTGGSGITLDYAWYVWQGDPGARPSGDEGRFWYYTFSFLGDYQVLPKYTDDTNYYPNSTRHCWYNAFHEAGLYNINLTVLGNVMVNPNNPDDPRNEWGVIGGGLTKANAIEVREPSELDMYVRRADPSYSHTVQSVLQGANYKAFVVDLVSLSWKAPGQTQAKPWHHWLTVIQPTVIKNDTALMYLAASSATYGAPTQVDPLMAQFSVETGSVVAILDNVPNLPTNVTSEDQLIASGIAAFLQQRPLAVPETLPLFPMVKSVFKGMNAVQWLLASPTASGNYPPVLVNQFVLAGGSENGWARGWTTWLTGATDFRVKGIIPIGFDALGLHNQFLHQYQVLGHVPEALQTYYDYGIAEEYTYNTPNEMYGPLAVKELRRRIERCIRNIHHDIMDEFFRSPVTGNNLDNVNALKDMLYKEDDPSSWQVLARISGYGELAAAYEYGTRLYEALKYYTETATNLKDGEKWNIARKVAGPTSPLYGYTEGTPTGTPEQDETDVQSGMACKLVYLMKEAEKSMMQNRRAAWTQYLIDPIFYNDPFVLYHNFASEFGNRLQIPKYVINATGDRFTAPDSSSFYFGLLSEQKYLRYIPNADHEMSGYTQEVFNAKPWYNAVVDGAGLPRFTWEYLSDEQLMVNLISGDTPTVKLWQARSETGRDFRSDPTVNPNPPVWVSAELTPVNNAVFVQVAPTLIGYTAYYIELTYHDMVSGKPMVFSTDIRIVGPYESPYEDLKRAPEQTAPPSNAAAPGDATP